jgi:hypothetical protein
VGHRGARPILGCRLRNSPAKGFDQFRIYDLAQPDQLIILPILRDKRDTDTLLKAQDIQQSGRHGGI